MKHLIYTIVIILIFSSCSDELEKVSENDFIGIWEITGRKIFNGIQISIQEENGKLKGKIVKLNDNKYVQSFVEIDDIWISEITRSSNYQFKLKEKRIGSELFALYELGTVEDFKVEFIDRNLIGLSKSNSDPLNSEIKYKRIE